MKLVVEQFPALLARLAVAFVDVEAGVDLGALRSDCGVDAVDIVVHVDAVRHGFLVVVFHDQILVEKAKGLLRRCGGEADQRGVEVFEHLAPEVVYGAVALVGDDEIKGLDGKAWVVFHGQGFFEQRLSGIDAQVVQVGRRLGLAFEHGVEALDRADDHAGGIVERRYG